MTPAPAPSEMRADMLAEMSACAYRLGMAFGREAERAENPVRRLEMYQLFDRCFFAVRVATGLQLRLRREGGLALARAPANDAEALGEPERPETERSETERPEPDEPGRERPERLRMEADRETERASLPLLLTTLKGVAAEAAALPGRPPAALPTLQALLARATAQPASPAKPKLYPIRPPLRDRLAGSAAVALAPAVLRPASGLPPRRATGPPGR